jgi:hypothetical protein
MNDEAEFLAAGKAFKPPSRAPVISAAVLGLLLGAVVGAGIMNAVGGSSSRRTKVTREVVPAASSAPAAVASQAPNPSEPPKPTLVERATAGDAEAVKALQAKAARTSEEAAALAYARGAAKRAEIVELKRKITLVPKIVDEDKATRERIKQLAEDREVATPMLLMVASLPDNVGPDLLYSIFRNMPSDNEGAQLAEELLYSSDVKAKTSLALASVLDLRKAETCAQAQAALKTVKEHADKRALPQLIRFHNKRGCGPKKMDDCWRCLRAPDVLKDVTVDVMSRPAP